MFKKILKNTFPLVIITFVAALLLSVVYQVTKDKIAEEEKKEKMESFYLVFPTVASFEPIDADTIESYIPESRATVSEAYLAKNSAGETEGLVLSVTSPSGYGGSIDLSVGILNDGSISGVKVTRMNETSGLGSNCQNPDWISQFNGKNTNRITYSKNGNPQENEIDAISQATITTKAVLEAVNEGLRFSKSIVCDGWEG